MRPDLDDYEEIDLSSEEAPRSRAMSWVVLSVAVVGFGALAYYAYRSGTQSINEGETLVVEADPSPIKEAPVDPEGEQFANKDKTIYDVIAPSDADKKVEQLLPDAEPAPPAKEAEKAKPKDDVQAPAPVESAKPDVATTTFVNEHIGASGKPVQAASAAGKQETKTADPVKPASEKPAKAEKPAEPKPAPSVEAPKIINEKHGGEKKTVTIAAPVEEVTEVPAPKATAKAEPKQKSVASKKEEKKANAAGGGAYKIQLGAFQSEAEAKANWNKISARFAGVIHGSPIIVEAELDNGTFYRLRAGGYVTAADAKAACVKLAAKSQPCFPVGK